LINTKIDLKPQLDWSKLDETLRKVSTVSSQINYFDEDEDLNFINLNKNLLNTTEQTVYIVCQFIFIYKKKYSFCLIYFQRMIINIIMFHILFQNLKEFQHILLKIIISLFVYMHFQIDIDQHL